MANELVTLATFSTAVEAASRRVWIAFGLTLISFLAYATFFRLIGP